MQVNYENFGLVNRLEYLVRLYSHLLLPLTIFDNQDLILLKESFLVVNLKYKNINYIKIEKKMRFIMFSFLLKIFFFSLLFGGLFYVLIEILSYLKGYLK